LVQARYGTYHTHVMKFRAILYVCITIPLCWIASGVYGQSDLLYDSIEEQIIYSNERAGIIIAHSHGFGLGYRTGINKNIYNTRVFTFDLVSIRSPKQIKVINPYANNAKRYVYGKLNDVFFLRATYGNKKLLNRKPYWGGVELRWVYEAGFSAAIEKPYYLFVRKIINNDYVEIVTERYTTDISDDIYGRAPFTKGLNEISLVPGLIARMGINAEFGQIKTSIRSLEAGISLDVFPQGVTIMADDLNQKLFMTFYIGIGFGKRYNKY
jgi:hypothetical protein